MNTTAFRAFVIIVTALSWVAVLIWLAGLALWLLATIAGGGSVSEEEINRVTSPDGAVDAMVLERNGGATVDYAYDVHLVPAGATVEEGADPAARLYGLTRGTASPGPYGLAVRWEDNEQVSVDYLEARSIIIEPTEPVMVEGRSITVTLHAGVTGGPRLPITTTPGPTPTPTG